MEPLSGREIETPERLIHITGIETGVRRGDPMRFSPQRLTLDDPGSLVFRQILHLGTRCAHD